jgi:hypothetical protein
VDNVTQDFGLEIKQGAVIPRLAKRAEGPRSRTRRHPNGDNAPSDENVIPSRKRQSA